MATRADLELAKRLVKSSIVSGDALRDALAFQAQLESERKVAPLERVLVAKGLLPRIALETLAGKDPLETQPFEGYKLERVLGEGGSSVVYGGRYLKNRARVAVKVFDPVQALRKDLLERFYEEARLLISLEHDNVVTGYETGIGHGLHFFSMDWIEGPTVLEMIERAGVVESTTALFVASQMAKALAFLHKRGLLHRDIKPGNVMIDGAGRARLIDLGLVRRFDPTVAAGAAAAPAEETVTVGTVEYISPEQARGRGDIDVRTDIYSLGVSLYHMVVGDVPYHGETDYEVMAKHILSGLDSQKVKNRRIAPEVHYAITKMMSKEREFRYASCDEVVADLARFLPAGGPPPIVLPVSSKTAPQETTKPSVPRSPAVTPVQKGAKSRIRSSGEIKTRRRHW